METQNNTNNQQENLGGTTNLSLDQLKQEGGIANPTEDNPNQLDNPDDVHEIQASDDLNEPNTDEYQPDEEGDAANPAELNS